jgi:hypothetical protein
METHRLRNLLHPDLLRERLEQEELPRTTLSFYRYVRLKETEDLRHALYTEWEQLGVLGRIYISQEGVNAQISLPTSNLDAFRSALDAQRSLPRHAMEDRRGRRWQELPEAQRSRCGRRSWPTAWPMMPSM